GAGAVGPGVNVASDGVDRVVRDAGVQAERRVDVVGSVAADGPGVAQVRVRVGDEARQGRRGQVLLHFSADREGLVAAEIGHSDEAAGAQVRTEGLGQVSGSGARGVVAEVAVRIVDGAVDGHGPFRGDLEGADAVQVC